MTKLSYKECKEFIKEEYSKSAAAKAHFGNYTRLSTDTMNDLIESWKNSSKEKASTKEVVVEETIEETIKEASDNNSEIVNILLRVENKLNIWLEDEGYDISDIDKDFVKKSNMSTTDEPQTEEKAEEIIEEKPVKVVNTLTEDEEADFKALLRM